MVIRYRYTEWDGTQEIPPLDPDDILNALTDDLMNFGDLQHALRNLMQRGMRNQQGDRTEGLRDLLQQLRQQRRQNLDRFDLSSAFEDIRNRLGDILNKERGTLEERLGDALGDQQSGEPGDGSEGPEESEGAESGGESQEGASGQEGGQQQGARSQQGGQSGQGQRGQGSQAGQQGGGDQEQFQQMLQNIVERKRSFLEGLPPDLPGQMKELQNYEFMDPEAQAEYQELMDMLKQAMTETFFNDLQQQIANMTPEDMERMKEMMRDLNQMLQERMQGGEPDFDSFMQKYGDSSGQTRHRASTSSWSKCSSRWRRCRTCSNRCRRTCASNSRISSWTRSLILDCATRWPNWPQTLNSSTRQRDLPDSVPVPRRRGDRPLQAAMHLMGDMQDIDEPESASSSARSTAATLDDVDIDQLRELLGDEAAETLRGAEAAPRGPRRTPATSARTATSGS